MYLGLKFIHVLAAIIFVGNISVGVLWKIIGDNSRDPRIIAHTMKGILLCDRVFTIPAVIVLLLAGFATAGVGHLSILGTGWILWGLTLFIISGIAFGPIVRAQRQLLTVAQMAQTSGVMDWQEYARYSRALAIAGFISLVAVLIAVAVMVTKPALPAF